jgi:hypothetical protein
MSSRRQWPAHRIDGARLATPGQKGGEPVTLSHATRAQCRLTLEEAICSLSGTNGALYAANGRIELDCVSEFGKDDADLRHSLRTAARVASDAGTVVMVRDANRQGSGGRASMGGRLAMPGFLDGRIAVTVVVGGIDFRSWSVEDHIARFESSLLSIALLIDRLRA